MSKMNIGGVLVNTTHSDVAKRGGKSGRTPEFRRYMAELKLTDPERWAQINKAERQYLDTVTVQLAADEQVIADQMEGWSDPTGQSGAHVKGSF